MVQEKLTARQPPWPKSTGSRLKAWLAGDVRLLVQVSFALLCIWIGVEFHFFVEYLASGGAAGAAYRPPGVEGFLPISSLMNLYYFALTGNIHAAHPAGLFILLAILAVSLVFGKSFCSWLCPVGLLSETLGDLGDKILGRRLSLPHWLDYPLRSIKYLLLGFFVYSIFFLMSAASLRAFLDSPYNVVSDVKMYYFFADISRFSLIVIGVLLLLSTFVRNFWCRYLCPYGALLGALSLVSPHKIKRNIDSCTDCGLCTQACPSSIRVDKVRTVLSDECTACLSCVDACPVAATLEFRLAGRKRATPKKLVAASVIGIFVLVTGLGILSGNWQSSTTREEYLEHQGRIHGYTHPTSTSEVRSLDRDAVSTGK